MKMCDFTSGTAKLELSMKALKAAVDEAEQYWSDEVRVRFKETYIEPLEPKVRNLLDAVHRLAEVLAAAEVQCGTNTNLL